MFCKVLLNFWKDSEPEMSTITSSKTAIAAVVRIYAKGIVDLLAFVFNILPLRPIVRILITAYLLTRTAWFLLGDAVPLTPNRSWECTGACGCARNRGMVREYFNDPRS